MMRFLNNIWRLVKSVFLPLFLLIVVGYLILRTTNISDKETLNIVLGVALGVMLGFIANMFKDSIDEFRNENRLRNISLKLLEQDARKVHKTIWLYGRPPLEFRYWSRLSQINNFLLLGSEPPFDEIFDGLWEFEKINEQIFLARSQKDDKQAYMFAMAFYKQALDDQTHRRFLSNFIKLKDVDEIEQNWIGIGDKNTQDRQHESK